VFILCELKSLGCSASAIENREEKSHVLVAHYYSMDRPLCNFTVKLIHAHFFFKDENISQLEDRYEKTSYIHPVRAFVLYGEMELL
jgi:hypothetical protein